MKLLRLLLWASHIALVVTAVFLYPVNWDEGWTFCTAKNLLESHHYGCTFNGNFTSARLITGWPTVFMAYEGFNLFGFNYAAGRSLFGFQALLLVFLITLIVRRSLGERAELWTLFILLTISGDPRVHPMMLGAQAWGEIPASLFFLTGVAMLHATLNDGTRFRILDAALAVGAFVLAGIIKVQFKPFVAAALVLAGSLLFVTRSWKKGSVVAGMGALVYGIVTALPYATFSTIGPLDLSGVGDLGWKAVRQVGLVTDPGVRLSAASWLVRNFWYLLWAFLIAALAGSKGKPLLLGAKSELLPIATFSSVLLVWFTVLAVDYPRYAAPGLILAAGLIAWPLSILMTSNGRFSLITGRELQLSPLIRNTVFTGILILGLGNILIAYRYVELSPDYNRNLKKVSEWMNSNSSRADVVFTYDSQLFLHLKGKFIYPPDILHALPPSERKWEIDIEGFPRPTWVILGDWSKMFGITVDKSKFRMVAQLGDFDIYKRATDQRESVIP